MLKLAFIAISLFAISYAQDGNDLDSAQGLSCPRGGYMFPDPQNLCFVWFCPGPGATPIKRACPKGVRVPSWWDGGELNMCFVVNIPEHGGEPICLRCAANDIPPDTQGCASNPCPEECTCENTEYTFRCDCPETGIATAVEYVPPPRDHCEPNQCENGASCQNQWDGFFCFCPAGFTGHRCEIPVCDWHPCFNGGTCVVDEVGYHCECTDCWTGSCCNVTVPGCSSEGCPTCKTGANCEEDINSCECIPPNDNPCQAGSECVDTNVGPECQACDEPECYLEGCKIRKDTCACMKGSCPTNSRCEDLSDISSHECICDECWEGSQCNLRVRSCACDNPCPNSATCRDTSDGPMCDCNDCVSGDYCDQPVYSCECNSPCEEGKACEMVDGKASCYCEDNCYFGQGCAQKRNTCTCNNPCSAGQTCSDVNGQPSCGCSDSCKTGPNCEETIQTCACAQPCNENQVCRDTNDGPVCSCDDSCTYGENCELRYQTCECSNSCNDGQECSEEGGVVACACANPCMTGPNCNEPLNTCECNNPCTSAQVCYVDDGELQCKCSDECYYGENCDQKRNTCQCSPCAEGEECSSDDSGAKTGCGCADACYYGPGCAFLVESCECNNPCAEGEVCSEGADGQLSCGCEDSCRTGSGCEDYINTCRCNNPCEEGETCSKNDNGELYCYCADPCKTGPGCTETVQSCACNNPCTGNEACVEADQSCVCIDKCTYGKGCFERYNTCECNNPCSAGQQCTMVDGEPTCGCADPCNTGPYCRQRLQTCECTPCSDGKSCRDTNNGTECYCADSCYTGARCDEKIQTCECHSCNDGQECYLDAYSLPACRCTDPCMTGSECETRINNCQCSSPCGENGSCVEGTEGPVCDACVNPCKTGPTCQDDVVSCACNSPCADSQVCTDDATNGPQCSCPSCYEGENCATKVNTCACNNPCSDNGRCQESTSGPVCRCDACFTGPSCTEPKNTCECANSCQDYQQCTNVGNNHTCGCPECFTGPTCSQRINSCKCNNPCKPADLCQDTSLGTPICKCDCVGNEQCVEDTITLRQECRCPDCYYNKPGERGCPSRITNMCECNTCTGEQEVCVDNEDPEGNVKCQIGNPSTGHSFTVVFEENNTEESITEIPLELYFSSAVWADGSRTVRVRTPGLPKQHFCYVDEVVEVPENTVTRYPVERCLRQNGTGLHQLAIRITEVDNKTISVYGINKDRWTADGFLALPDEQAGVEFQTSSYSPAHIATQFAIVVLYDDTEVTIKLADDNNLPAPYNKKGSVYTAKFQAFDTFQVQARCPGHIPSLATECPLDLTGTVITSTKQIHVFSGNIRAWVPDRSGKSRDHLVEQIMPRDRWGTDFAIVSIPNRVVGDILQILAVDGEDTVCHLYSRGGNNVDVNSEPEVIDTPETISLPYNGRYHRNVEIPSRGTYRLKCEKPVFVTQITKSQDQIYLYFNETFHDPVTMTVPPISQFTNNFFLNTPQFTGGENYSPQPYNTTFALLVARKGEEDTISLNQQPLSNFVLPWTNLPVSRDTSDKNLVGAVVKIPDGTNIIRNDEGHNFQCLVYGYDDRESYGFPAGMSLSKFRG